MGITTPMAALAPVDKAEDVESDAEVDAVLGPEGDSEGDEGAVLVVAPTKSLLCHLMSTSGACTVTVATGPVGNFRYDVDTMS